MYMCVTSINYINNGMDLRFSVDDIWFPFLIYIYVSEEWMSFF